MNERSLNVKRFPLTEEETKQIHRKWRTQLFRDAVSTFLALGCFGAGVAATILQLFVGKRYATFNVVALTGVIAGGVGVVALYWVYRRYSKDVRLDLRNRECEEWTVSATRVVEVIPDGSWPCLAVECGEKTLVLAGGWWQSSQGRLEGVEWTGAGKRLFPSTEFAVRLLPKSGRVLDVNVSGRKLKVEFKDSLASPLLAVQHSGQIDCRLYDNKLDDMIKFPEADKAGTT